MNKANLEPQGILQVFVGRWEQANVIDHPQQVLSRLTNYNWQEWLKLGINSIYLLGLFDNRGPIIVNEEQGRDISQIPNRTPSPFAITDHKAINPQLGNLVEAKKLVATIQEQGFRVLVDFVPNHTGTLHDWANNHPEYYVSSDQGVVSEFSGDVLKLNYANPQLRQEMVSVLQWIGELGVDGVRVDMAHLVPVDFWQMAWSTMRQSYPDFLAYAEAYTDNLFNLDPLLQLQQAGFTAIYHEPLFRNLRRVWEKNEPISGLVAHLDYVLSQQDASQTVDNAVEKIDLRSLFDLKSSTSDKAQVLSNEESSQVLRWLHYVANHDDVLENISDEMVTALWALVLFLPGHFLLYNGFLQGLKHRIAHHYVEILPEMLTTTASVPEAVMVLSKIRISGKWQAVQAKEENGLICLMLKSEIGNASLWINLSRNSCMIPDHSWGKGMVAGKRASDILNVGEVELFLN